MREHSESQVHRTREQGGGRCKTAEAELADVGNTRLHFPSHMGSFVIFYITGTPEMLYCTLHNPCLRHGVPHDHRCRVRVSHPEFIACPNSRPDSIFQLILKTSRRPLQESRRLRSYSRVSIIGLLASRPVARGCTPCAVRRRAVVA